MALFRTLTEAKSGDVATVPIVAVALRRVRTSTLWRNDTLTLLLTAFAGFVVLSTTSVALYYISTTTKDVAIEPASLACTGCVSASR